MALGSKNRDYLTSAREITNRLRYYDKLRAQYLSEGMSAEEADKKAFEVVKKTHRKDLPKSCKW